MGAVMGSGLLVRRGGNSQHQHPPTGGPTEPPDGPSAAADPDIMEAVGPNLNNSSNSEFMFMTGERLKLSFLLGRLS